jgi:hypothetical protein
MHKLSNISLDGQREETLMHTPAFLIFTACSHIFRFVLQIRFDWNIVYEYCSTNIVLRLDHIYLKRVIWYALTCYMSCQIIY